MAKHDLATVLRSIDASDPVPLKLRLAVADEIDRLRADLRAADKLAYACAMAIMRREVRDRTAIDDMLLRYLDVGGVSGPSDVPTWIAEYEAAQAAANAARRK